MIVVGENNKIMKDLKQFKHGEESTHSCCNTRLKKEGGKSKCCYCFEHEGCELVNNFERLSKNVWIEKESSESIMGVSQWKEYGKKYGYDKYFNQKIIDRVEVEEQKLLNTGHGGGNWRRLIIQGFENIKEVIKES